MPLTDIIYHEYICLEKKVMFGCHIPAFGAWNYRDDDLPITQCFDLAIQDRLMRRANRRGDGNCKRRLVVPFDAWPPAPRGAAHGKVIRRELAQKQWDNVAEEMMQWRAVGAYGTKRKVGDKAVDEDLYKVPQPLIYPKRRKVRTAVYTCF